MKTWDILPLSLISTVIAESSVVHILWHHFPPLAFQDENGALRGVLANLAMDIGENCFDRNPVYSALNSTMAFEERLIDGDTFVAGPVSRGVNTCVKWPSDQYFIPVLQSNGPSVLKSETRSSNAMVQFLSACWALPFIILVSAGIAGCVMWILDHYNNQSDFPSPMSLGVWDGFWWAIVSASTVGYGDKAPRSVVGRLWGVVWIIVGINTMSFLFTLMNTAFERELHASSSIRGVQIAVVNGSEEHVATLLEGADVAVFDSYPELFQSEIFNSVDGVVVDTYHLLSLTPDNTRGMEVTSSLSHTTVHGLLLSNTSVNNINCALNIVQTRRIDTVTAMDFHLNALESEIGVAAYSACAKLFGSWDIMLYILLAILVGMILILKICEILYHQPVRKKKLANCDNSVPQTGTAEQYAHGLSKAKTANQNKSTTA